MDGRANNVGLKGNRGGGRHSAYEEHQDAEWHAMIWGEDQDIGVLEEKIKSGKYCAKDVASLKILQGDKHLIAKLMDKILPDLRKSDAVFAISPRDSGMTEAEIEEVRCMFPDICPTNGR